MQRHVILIHGFANPGGKNTTDRLDIYFRSAGYSVMQWDYPWRGLIGVRLCNKPDGYGLRRYINSLPKEQKVYVVAHSNGAPIARLASLDWTRHDGEKFSGAYIEQIALIDPALNNKAKFGPNVGKIHVFHNPSDWVVEVARFLPFHPWGNMGRVGYKGDDQRFRNYKLTSKGITAHNDFFNEDFIAHGFGMINHEFTRWEGK